MPVSIGCGKGRNVTSAGNTVWSHVSLRFRSSEVCCKLHSGKYVVAEWRGEPNHRDPSVDRPSTAHDAAVLPSFRHQSRQSEAVSTVLAGGWQLGSCCHFIGPIPWGHRGPLCHCCCRCGHRFYIAIRQVSLLSHAACAIAIAGFGSSGLGSGVDSSDTWWMAM